jgi:hypothetical protein
LTELVKSVRRQEVVLKRQEKVLKFVSAEVVIQHRIRLDIWTSSKRTKVESAQFKNSLAGFYQCEDPVNHPQELKCMILDTFFPRKDVIGAHIWKHCTAGNGLEEFGLNKHDVHSYRNGMLICEEIKKAFDAKRLCFLVDRIHPTDFIVKVLDPELLGPPSPIIQGTRSFADIDGCLLVHPPGVYPFRRILDFHAKLSYQNAISRGWLAHDASFDDFFDMSVDSSIPDLNLYQDEDDVNVDIE